MAEISEVDSEFLWRLSSLYESLTQSAVDPVVLRTSLGGAFGAIYYDAHDDDEVAFSIMKSRIELAENDIRKHHKAHKSFLECFYDIDECINTSNRERIGDSANKLCDLVLGYLNLVEQHELKLREESFLHPPTCLPGHYFQILGSVMGRALELEFNPQRTKVVAEAYLNEIKGSIVDFVINHNGIYPTKIESQIDTGEGITDNSLRGRIELNKELLSRIGFSLE